VVGPVRRLAVACRAGAREAGMPAATRGSSGVWPSGWGRPDSGMPRLSPTYVLTALVLAHSDDPAVLDSKKAWHPADSPEGFSKLVYPADRPLNGRSHRARWRDRFSTAARAGVAPEPRTQAMPPRTRMRSSTRAGAVDEVID
jgi:hypothetical protein